MANQWTPERKAKQAAAIQAWQPWKRATGPRTVEGKAKASRNAYAGAMRLELRALGRALSELEAGFLTSPHARHGSFPVYARTARNDRDKALGEATDQSQRPAICAWREGH